MRQDDGRTQYYGRGPDDLEERLERNTRERTGIFRGNRSLTIIFIDVVIILIIFAIYMFFFAGPGSVRTIDGYRFALSARRIDSAALVSLRIRATEDADPVASAGENAIVSVRFTGSAGAAGAFGADDAGRVDEGTGSEGAGGETIKDVLPAAGGADRVFRTRVELATEAETVAASVRALGEEFILEVVPDD